MSGTEALAVDRINILHLSDVHVTKKHIVDQRIVLSAFFSDLEKICDSDLAPHYVVFSGDLVNDPDESDAYNLFTEELLIPILDTTSVDLDNFIFCAGNHDVSRAVCNHHPLELDAIATRLGDHGYFNTLYGHSNFPDLVIKKINGYTSFVKTLSVTHTNRANIFYNICDFPHSGITFVALNSSLLSLASLKGGEQGRLNYPDLALNEAFGEVQRGRLIVSIQHHPISWFDDATASEFERTISHKAAIHLFGHLHEALPRTLSTPLGQTTFLQAPSLFSSRKYLNGYSVISISPDRKLCAAFYRTYYEGRRGFGAGENVVPNGEFFPNSDSTSYWTDQPLQINLRRFRRWLGEHALVEKIEQYNKTTVEKKLSDVFVCPPLVRLELKKTEEQAASEPFSDVSKCALRLCIP